MFKSLQDFDVPELRSTYVKDLVYTVRDNNKILNAMAEVWALQGKVVFVHQTSQMAKIEGYGHTETTFLGMTKAAWRSLWQ